MPQYRLLEQELRHDARNQLFALRTSFATLELTGSRPDKLQRNLHLCMNALDKLSTLLDAYFALQTGEPSLTSVRLDEAIRDSAAVIKSGALSLGIRLELDLEPVTVETRPLLAAMTCRRMLNATIALAQGQIRITLRNNGHEAELSVRYHRRAEIDPAVATQSDNGYELVSEIVELHGARVSREPGKLVIRWPLPPGDNAEQPSP